MNSTIVLLTVSMLSLSLVAQAQGGLKGLVKGRKGLTTYSGKIQGWNKGVKNLGVVGEGESDHLITGKTDNRGNFTLNFSTNKSMLNEYATAISETIPYGKMCFYDVCDIKISSPQALWLKLPSFYIISNGDHTEEIYNNEAIKAPKPLDRFKVVSAIHIVYSSDEVDVVGQAVSKESKLTLKYDMHLPAGWSFIEEWSDRKFNLKGDILSTERIFRSVLPTSRAWKQ